MTLLVYVSTSPSKTQTSGLEVQSQVALSVLRGAQDQARQQADAVQIMQERAAAAFARGGIDVQA